MSAPVSEDVKVAVATWAVESQYNGSFKFYLDEANPGIIRGKSLACRTVALVNHDRILHDQLVTRGATNVSQLED